MDPALALRLADLCLGGDLPEPMARTGKRKKIADLGWRILPVPHFVGAGLRKSRTRRRASPSRTSET